MIEGGPHQLWQKLGILEKKKMKWREIVANEMARKAIKRDFWQSKMAAGGHFVKLKKKVAYWYEMARNAIKRYFRSSSGHFVKNESCILIWNGEKCDRKWFSVIQNGPGGHFVKNITKNESCVLIWNDEKCDLMIFGHPKWRDFR